QPRPDHRRRRHGRRLRARLRRARRGERGAGRRRARLARDVPGRSRRHRARPSRRALFRTGAEGWSNRRRMTTIASTATSSPGGAVDARVSSAVVGRFAPSPTGPLHLGSLVAAVGSWLSARAAGGRWIVRMEDLDAPRVVPGAADEILGALARYGLEWDGEVVHQSRRVELYEGALARLR